MANNRNSSRLFFQFSNSDIEYFENNFKDITINYTQIHSGKDFINTINNIIKETSDYLDKDDRFFTSQEKCEFITAFGQLLLLRNELAPYIVYLNKHEIEELYRQNNYISIDDKQFYKIIDEKSDEKSFTGLPDNTVFIRKILKLRSKNEFFPTLTFAEYDKDDLSHFTNFSDYLKNIHFTTLQQLDNFDDLVNYKSLNQTESSSRKKYIQYYSIYDYKNDNLIANLDAHKTIYKELYHNQNLFKRFVDTLEKQINKQTHYLSTRNRIDDRNYVGYLVFMDYDYKDIHLSSFDVYQWYYKIIKEIYFVTRAKLPQSLYKDDLLIASQNKSKYNKDFQSKIEDANEKMAFRYGSDLKLSLLLKKWNDFPLYIPIKLNDDLSNYAYSVYLHITKEIKRNTFKNKDDDNEELTDAMMNTNLSAINEYQKSMEDQILSHKFNKYINEVIFKNAKNTNTIKNYDKNIFIGFSKEGYSFSEYGALNSYRKTIIKDMKITYISNVITSFYDELVNDHILEENNGHIIMRQMARLKYLFYLYDESCKENETGQFNFDDFKDVTKKERSYYKEHQSHLNRNFCWYYSAINNPLEKMDLKTFQNMNSDITEYYDLLNNYFNEIINHVQTINNPTGKDYLGISKLDIKTGVSELVEHQNEYYDEMKFNKYVTTQMINIYYKEEQNEY